MPVNDFTWDLQGRFGFSLCMPLKALHENDPEQWSDADLATISRYAADVLADRRPAPDTPMWQQFVMQAVREKRDDWQERLLGLANYLDYGTDPGVWSSLDKRN